MPMPATLLHSQPIEQRIDALFALSRQHAEHFCSPGAWLSRQRYLAQHPTSIVVMKCMDGRIHIPHATRTPLGIITPFRNLGGIFDLGWPYLGELLTDTVVDAANAGRGTLLLITYHFSHGNQARGVPGLVVILRQPKRTPMRLPAKQVSCLARTISRSTRWYAGLKLTATR